MIHSIDPKGRKPLDPYKPGPFPALPYKRIGTAWQGVFRHALLDLLPVDGFSEHCCPLMGRRTKEPYSMAGLVFLMEFQNWTEEQVAKAYLVDNRVGRATGNVF